MALMKCKECDKEISDKAASCPNCGARLPARTSLKTWIVAGISASIVVSCIVSQDRQHVIEAAKPLPSAQEIVQKKMDDEHIAAALMALKKLRSGSKNPQSFELNEFLIFQNGVTCYEYHATNSFNAMMPGSALYDPTNGVILTREENGNSFIRAYNKLCTAKGGRQLARGINLLKSQWQ